MMTKTYHNQTQSCKLLILLILISFCQACSAPKARAQDIKPSKPIPANINLSILLDLSARIKPTAKPIQQQKDKDIEYLKIIYNSISQHIKNKNLATINETIQTYIEPIPTNNKIQKILKRCKHDFNENNPKHQKVLGLTTKYTNDISIIYDIAMTQNTYLSSDVWGFFKHLHPNIINAEKRNILVILTDGYIYHKNHTLQNKSQYSYITPKLIEKLKLNNPDFKRLIKNSDFGIILATPFNLSYLEVLIIGVNETQQPPIYNEVLTFILGNWLQQMGVKHYSIIPNYNSVIIKKQIEKFILLDN